jgi:hypothetical protein
MKVFITNVDAPLGHCLSRAFAQSTVPSNKQQEESAVIDEGEPAAPIQPPEPYIVTGTLSSIPVNYLPSEPGEMFFTGIKEKDDERKANIEKLSNLGQKPSWVSEEVPVSHSNH